MQIAICDDNKVFLDDIHDKLTKLLPEEVEYLRFKTFLTVLIKRPGSFF